MKHPAVPELLQLVPEPHHRIWGGQRLRPSPDPIGEVWIVYEHNRIASGSFAGRTLAEAAAALGAALLGERALARTGMRFPLLIKLLDCADWLSVQVHPNDEQAAQLEGPGQFGKTEAWHILEADEGARLIAGVKPGATPEALAAAIRDGTILDHVQYHPVRAGDTFFMPAGTLHALGPGLLLYEVQQTSDITYRVFDWNRPASAGRALHVEQSAAVTDAGAGGQRRPLPPLKAHDRQELVACPYFTLEILSAQTEPVRLDTHGQSFHALTVVAGQAEVEAGAERLMLQDFESLIVPASAGEYAIRPLSPCRLLKSSVEPGSS
jgi:mannose-6-phosphate isomerase